MPGRWCGRGGFYAGQVVRSGRLRCQVVRPGFYAGGLVSKPLGEPSNEVGRASTKGPLGKPVLIGRTRTHWANPYSLGKPLNHFHSGQRLRLLGAVPARHCKCLLGTST